MLIKTLFPHGNLFGASYMKSVGDEYRLPEETARPLIESGLAEAVSEDTVQDETDEPAAPVRQGRGKRVSEPADEPDGPTDQD